MALYDFSSIKNDLISSLWKKNIMDIGNYIAKRRFHKQLKTLTLTHPRNMAEIKQLEEDKISKRRDIVGWNCEYQPCMRLETEGIKVKGGTKFEHSIYLDSSLKNNFNFDIINLDYTSQNPQKINGRFEDELLSLEHVIISRKRCLNDKKYSLILFTTMINTCDVKPKIIVSASNKLNPHSKPLAFSQNTNPIVNPIDKIDTISEYYNHMLERYKLKYISFEDKTIKLDNTTFVYSVASIIEW